jgi:hypothetical protein
MITITSQNRAGINIGYPLLIRNLRANVPLVSLEALTRYSPWFITVNLAISVACLLASGDGKERMLDRAGAAFLAYVMIRVSLQRKMTAAAGNGPYVTKPSSGLIWLNHFTTGGVFVIYLSRVLQDLDSADLQVLLKVLLAFFLVYTAMPVLNYVSFRLRR